MTTTCVCCVETVPLTQLGGGMKALLLYNDLYNDIFSDGDHAEIGQQIRYERIHKLRGYEEIF